jgi:hypothetical protein
MLLALGVEIEITSRDWHTGLGRISFETETESDKAEL